MYMYMYTVSSSFLILNVHVLYMICPFLLVTMLRALFEYTAQEDEELSFPEGAIIRLLRTDDNGIDDGWWEGSYEGKKGVFPSIVVEIITNENNPVRLSKTILF